MDTENTIAITELMEQCRSLPAIEAAALLGSQTHEVIEDVLRTLPNEVSVHIASHLPGTLSASQADSVEVSENLKGTVSEIMVDPKGVLPASTTVAGALDHLVHTVPTSKITYIYVTDELNKILGVVVMRDLLLARPGQTLGEVMTADPFTFSETSTFSEAVNVAMKRRYRLYPVVNELGHIVGLVYGWQLFERMATEISAQSGSMVGVDKEERVGTALMKAFRMRHPWLQVNLLTAFAAAFVVGVFEDTISKIVVLAVFLPVLAGQSGNTGCQALAITLRGLTLGELDEYPVRKLLLKEVTLGALNGFVVGVVAAIAMFIYASFTATAQPLLLGVVVLVAMTGACVGSGMFGVLVPITLKRFGADPATASSIFLTTFTDILGMGLMLFLATSLLL